MPTCKKRLVQKDIPVDFDENTVNTIKRIEECSSVVGIMHFHNSFVQVCTVPESMTQTLICKLPALTSVFRWSIGEIDILDDLVAYRIMTNTIEIMAVSDKEFTSCVVHKLPKKKPSKKYFRRQ